MTAVLERPGPPCLRWPPVADQHLAQRSTALPVSPIPPIAGRNIAVDRDHHETREMFGPTLVPWLRVERVGHPPKARGDGILLRARQRAVALATLLIEQH